MANPVKAVAQKVRSADGPKVDAYVKRNCDLGLRAVSGRLPKWQEALAFFDNDQWVEISAITGSVDRMETREGGSKPRYRSRLTRNKFTPAIMREASLVASTPEYELDPGAPGPEARNTARLAERVLAGVHELIELDQRGIETILYALLTGAGFSMPQWDSSCGTYLMDDEYGRGLHTGDVDVPVFHQGEVFWEPGLPFDRSKWHAIRRARTVQSVKEAEGYCGPDKLKADAQAGMWERPGTQLGDLCFVWTYLEQPSRKRPRGRMIQFVGEEEVQPEAAYPRTKGCALHKLAWVPQPSRHRDLGAGEQIVDIQRTFQRTINQMIQWRNFALYPQKMAPKGSIDKDPTDEPGAVIYYKPVSGQKPEWAQAPEMPASFEETLDRCERDMDDVLGMRDLPAGVESGTGIQEAVAREGSFRNIFLTSLKGFYENQGEHVLEIVQARYTEPRLIPVQGRTGVELIEDFLGAQLGELGSVRVKRRSLEARSRAETEARVRWLMELGLVEPHQAMAAINGGTAEDLLDDYELDVARQHREIRDLMLLGGWQPSMRARRFYELRAVGLAPEGADPLQAEMPALPMAEEYDNHAVHIDVLRQWMKTREFEMQPPLIQQAAREHLAQHQLLADVEWMKAAQRQGARAEALGSANAARGSAPAGLPSPKSEAAQAKEVQGGGRAPVPAGGG